MGRTRTDEFRKDAVRIALTSGLTRKQVADDLGVRQVTGFTFEVSSSWAANLVFFRSAEGSAFCARNSRASVLWVLADFRVVSG